MSKFEFSEADMRSMVVVNRKAQKVGAAIDLLKWDEGQHPRVPAGGAGGGQFTAGDGGGATETSDADLVADFEARQAAIKEKIPKISKIADDVAINMGIARDRIEVKQSGTPATVGEQMFLPAGTFFPKTGKIELYAEQLLPSDEDEIAGVIAHEVTHAHFAVAKQTLHSEGEKWQAEMMNAPKTEGYEKYFHPSGEYKSGAAEAYVKEHFPGHWVFNEVSLGQLAKTDGMSPYSRDWWDAAASGKANAWSAVNETLAEMGRKLYTTHTLVGGSRDWKDFYRRVVEVGRTAK